MNLLARHALRVRQGVRFRVCSRMRAQLSGLAESGTRSMLLRVPLAFVSSVAGADRCPRSQCRAVRTRR